MLMFVHLQDYNFRETLPKKCLVKKLLRCKRSTVIIATTKKHSTIRYVYIVYCYNVSVFIVFIVLIVLVFFCAILIFKAVAPKLMIVSTY